MHTTHTFTRPALAALNPLAYERLLDSEAAADQNDLRFKQLCDADTLAEALRRYVFRSKVKLDVRADLA